MLLAYLASIGAYFTFPRYENALWGSNTAIKRSKELDSLLPEYLFKF